MKTKILLTAFLCVLILFGLKAHAQNIFPSSGKVGIGTTTPDKSSLLEIKSTTKGILIPRMTFNQRNNIASPALGLLIYQTNSKPGFYYYNDSGWAPVTPPFYGWSIAGNLNTDPSLDFIGTLDAHALVFKVNNVKSGYLDYSTSNTSFGYQTLISNTGNYNTATGIDALMSNTGGYNNTATGSYSLVSNTQGIYNTATGSDALHNNTEGTFNTGIGSASLYKNITGSYNTAVGMNASYLNNGSNNTAIGYQAMYGSLLFNYVTIGNGNTAMGYQAMHNNYNGNYNTASGYQALVGNQQGSFNTAMGSNSLTDNLTGNNNTAVGYYSLDYNTSGHDNTAVGYQALNFNNNDYNTAVGFKALYNNSDGYNNTSIGIGADVTQGNFYNSTVIGANAMVNSSNKIRLGDAGILIVESAAGSWTTSDGRFKNNIKENVKGLEFIKLLKPVTYNFDTKKFEEFLMQNYPDSIKKKRLAEISKENATSKASTIIQSGFVAQEVEEAIKKSGYNFNGVHMPENSTDNWSLSYEKLTVPLVKAVQELSKMNDEKDSAIQQQNIKLNDLQNQINELKAMIVSNQSTVKTQLSSASLEQNIPNPFSHNTTIGYTLPQKFTAAQIVITDKNGKTVKSVNVSGSGKGNINVDATTLSSGAYQYSLIIDGRLIDTKQMILAK